MRILSRQRIYHLWCKVLVAGRLMRAIFASVPRLDSSEIGVLVATVLSPDAVSWTLAFPVSVSYYLLCGLLLLCKSYVQISSVSGDCWPAQRRAMNKYMRIKVRAILVYLVLRLYVGFRLQGMSQPVTSRPGTWLCCAYHLRVSSHQSTYGVQPPHLTPERNVQSESRKRFSGANYWSCGNLVQGGECAQGWTSTRSALIGGNHSNPIRLGGRGFEPFFDVQGPKLTGTLPTAGRGRRQLWDWHVPIWGAPRDWRDDFLCQYDFIDRGDIAMLGWWLSVWNRRPLVKPPCS